MDPITHPTTTTRRKLLVIGATGKQGRALIQALVSPPSAPRSHPTTTAAAAAVSADKDTKAVIVTTSEADSRVGTPSSLRPDPPTISWDILAVTRNPSSPRAKSLLQLLPSAAAAAPETEPPSHHTISLIQGDLDQPSTIRAIFSDHQIWGVFTVLMYPGVGKTSKMTDDTQQHIEVRQGKLVADLATEFGVDVFVYSSSLPAPLEEMSEEERNPADGDKLANEGYIKSLGLDRSHHGNQEGKKGLNWVIIRPGFFMENLEGFLGSITVTVFREGLSEDATLPLIATRDIGEVVSGIFRDHTRFLHKTLAITSGTVTMRDVMAAHQRATGKPIPAIPAAVAKLLIKMNAGTRRVLKLYQLSHDARLRGNYYPEFDAQCALARSICHLHSYEEWRRLPADGETSSPTAVRVSVSENGRPGTAGTGTDSAATGLGFEAGWNQVSLWKLVTGRS
ncbi:hypothetical protein QBC37DRAFT_107373 [Rhypophila decipiens]|uniref:NmrA-like domain-containing protein n=1 Tax=Rhypophila decipiens TaxID=261697 RepID=A0AAN6XUN1_9PEZI|nr:hypothetical protein QBC37DRAFT_107373 [Rhypophila decipiens]